MEKITFEVTHLDCLNEPQNKIDEMLAEARQSFYKELEKQTLRAILEGYTSSQINVESWVEGDGFNIKFCGRVTTHGVPANRIEGGNDD